MTKRAIGRRLARLLDVALAPQHGLGPGGDQLGVLAVALAGQGDGEGDGGVLVPGLGDDPGLDRLVHEEGAQDARVELDEVHAQAVLRVERAGLQAGFGEVEQDGFLDEVVDVLEADPGADVGALEACAAARSSRW
ncbi:hypothetical protein ACFQ0M_12105 [Kitasatospora aburaviensis]